jgi:hypothetical protein
VRYEALHPEHTLVDAEAIRRARQQRKKMVVWTVNDAERKRELAQLGVDAIITDDPVRIAYPVRVHCMPILEAGMKTTKRAKTTTNSKSAQRAYTPTPQEIVDLYKQMLFIRRFEEHCDKAYRQDKIGGYLHLYIGQEALALGFIHPPAP